MKKKIITENKIINNRYFEEIMEARAFRLLGVFWKKEVKWFIDKSNNNLIFIYD